VRRYHGVDWLADAVEKGVLTSDEAAQLREVEGLVARVIAVDHFDPAELKPNYITLGHNVPGAKTAVAG
jgi:acyl-CoA dehydrogenase